MKLYTVTDVALILKVSKDMVRKLLKSGQLTGVKVGNLETSQYRIEENDLRRFLRQRKREDEKRRMKSEK